MVLLVKLSKAGSAGIYLSTGCSAGLVDPQDGSAGTIIQGRFCWHIIMNKLVLLDLLIHGKVPLV